MGVASILGMGLNCALGSSLDACIAALRTDCVPVGVIELDDFNEPFRTPFYRVADGADPLDPQRLDRLLPPVVKAALDQAGLSTRERRGMVVFIGSSCFRIAHSEARYAADLRTHPHAAIPMPEVGFDAVGALAARVAGSAGRVLAWHTACTSAANALLAAQRMLAAGRIRHALVVGVELANRTSLSGFAALQLVSDVVRPFDAARAGIVLGEGVGAVVLGGGSDAPVRLTGGAANVDTWSVTGANPDGSRLAAVQEQALRTARRRPADVVAVKAHATGTLANDLGEAQSLHRVFARLPPVCALKPRLGHTLGACGVTELALFAGALSDGFLPATPGFTQTDPDVDLAPLTTAMPAAPGCYLLNQFGFGGANASLVLEYG